MAANRKQPHFLGARVTSGEQAAVDHAARLRGVSRSDYVRLVVLAAAEESVRVAMAKDGKAGERTR